MRIGSTRSGYWQLNHVQIKKMMDRPNAWDVEKDVDRDVEKDVEKLTEIQIEILSLVERNNKITTKQLSIQIGINHRNTQKNISELQRKGFIKRIGPPKGGHWKIIEKKEED